ncbi:right-handed parallel beta-helix repeat-containing protein [Planctomycetota bacterium]
MKTIYIDSNTGSDNQPGTKDKPLRTLLKASELVNQAQEKGPCTLVLELGIYAVSEPVLFKKNAFYTSEHRLVIKASTLPDDPGWHPSLMPILLSTQNHTPSDNLKRITETYTLKFQCSHVTVQGLKFLGNPLSSNMHACVEQHGDRTQDLMVTQCMFVGNPDTLNIYCPIISSGNGLVVDHCIFSHCCASAVFWDGFTAISNSGCAMRYCIVDHGYHAGVWTCQTNEDFYFSHNIITQCQYVWLRKPGDKQTYSPEDSVCVGNQHFSGYGTASGPMGPTEPEVGFRESNVIKHGEIVLERDKTSKHYLHVLPGTLGSHLNAGLFKKK